MHVDAQAGSTRPQGLPPGGVPSGASSGAPGRRREGGDKPAPYPEKAWDLVNRAKDAIWNIGSINCLADDGTTGRPVPTTIDFNGTLKGVFSAGIRNSTVNYRLDDEARCVSGRLSNARWATGAGVSTRTLRRYVAILRSLKWIRREVTDGRVWDTHFDLAQISHDLTLMDDQGNVDRFQAADLLGPIRPKQKKGPTSEGSEKKPSDRWRPEPCRKKRAPPKEAPEELRNLVGDGAFLLESMVEAHETWAEACETGQPLTPKMASAIWNLHPARDPSAILPHGWRWHPRYLKDPAKFLIVLETFFGLRTFGDKQFQPGPVHPKSFIKHFEALFDYSRGRGNPQRTSFGRIPKGAGPKPGYALDLKDDVMPRLAPWVREMVQKFVRDEDDPSRALSLLSKQWTGPPPDDLPELLAAYWGALPLF